MKWQKYSNKLNFSEGKPIKQRTISYMSLLFLVVSFILAGCNGSDSDSVSSEPGTLVVALTDAEGDFLSYTVDVVSLSMLKADGTVVETMPLTTRIDFAEYTEMTEFLTAATVPSGVYVKATMTVDYQNADIQVEDVNGDPVKVVDIVDVDNNPVTMMDLSVRLEGKNSLRIAPGIPAHLTLDFDLNASNKIVFDPNTGEPTQTVAPFLLADVALEKPKVHRLRGPLASVNVDSGEFKVVIRPFRHTLINDSRFGALTVKTTSNTVYEIDQQDYMGQDGLLALEQLPKFAATVVIGELKPRLHTFIAREVYAGSSVPGGDKDVVKGTVISRDNTRLTVKGATLLRAAGSVAFNDTISIQISDATIYKRQLSMDTYTSQDVSVGQSVTVFGTLTDASVPNLELDATSGMLRMKMSTLSGNAVAGMDNNPENALVMDLQDINKRRVEIFDFSGTGVDADNDADPANYEINKGELDLSAIFNNAPIKARGFVTPWASAPNDFDAYTVVDLSDVRAAITLNWEPATTVPFVDISADSLTVNLDGAGLFHHVSRGGISTDLNSFSTAAIIQPTVEGEGFYALAEAGSVQIHFSFADFVADLEARIGTGRGVSNLIAAGKFNDETATMTARRIAIKIVPIITIK